MFTTGPEPYKLYGQDLNHHLMLVEYTAEQKQESETLDMLHKFVQCAQMFSDDFQSVKVSPFFDCVEMHITSTSKGYLNHCAYQMIKETAAFDFLKDNREFIDILSELEHLPE